MIIAIDGPAAAGKGTLARRLAQHLNWTQVSFIERWARGC